MVAEGVVLGAREAQCVGLGIPADGTVVMRVLCGEVSLGLENRAKSMHGPERVRT